MRTQLYTNNANCQDCKAVKFYLEKANIEFDYNVISIEEMGEITNKYNYVHVPIVTFDSELIVGDSRLIVDRIKQLTIKPLEK